MDLCPYMVITGIRLPPRTTGGGLFMDLCPVITDIWCEEAVGREV